MSDLFVKFPGTAGNYISTDSVNLLDGDTANLQQSKGQWIKSANAALPVLDASIPAKYGDNSMKVVADGSGIVVAQFTTPVVVSGEHTFSIWCYTDVPDRQVFIRFGGTPDSASVNLPVDTWTQVSVTKTTAGGLTTIRFRNSDGSTSPVNGDTLWIDAACLRTGSDPAFVPSSLIVGNLDIRAKAASVLWAGSVSDILSASPDYQMFTNPSDFGVQYTSDGGFRTHTTPLSGTPLVDGVASEFTAQLDFDANTFKAWIDGILVIDGNALGDSSLVPASTQLGVGSAPGGGSRNFSGDIYSAEVRDGIDGPAVARFDAQDVP